MDLKRFLRVDLMESEIALSRDFGCFVIVPQMRTPKPFDKEKFRFFLDKKFINLPKILIDIYSKVKLVYLSWELLNDEKDKEDTTLIFKEDEWLNVNFFEKGVSWSEINDSLKGTIMFPDISTFLGDEGNESEGFKIVGNHLNLNTANWYPIDFHRRYTAFLKSENKEIIDNVWLIDLDGQKVYDMKVSIEKYFELGYKAKLLYGWQSVYVLKKKSEHYEFMKRFLPKIVPHLTLDLTEFGINN